MSAMMQLSATALAVLYSSAVPFVASQSTLATVISNRNDLASFNKIMDASGLAADLFRSAGFDGTVFAPNDDAFAELSASISTMLLESEWAEHSACFVSYHTVKGTFLSNSLMDGMNLTTLDGDNLTVSLNPTSVNDANIAEADVTASNGVIQIINTVLTPSCVNESVVEKLTANDDFSILLKLVELAGLSDVLATSSPITLFAPPNEAWEERGDRFIENLSDPDNLDFLRAFLMNHVLNGNWYSSRLDMGESFTLETTLETTAFFYNQSNTMFMNNAEIVNNTAMLASNGVIHTTDSVVILAALGDILMNSQVVSDVISFSNFTAALTQANFLDALFLDSLNAPRTTTVFAPDDNAFAKVPTEVLDKLLDPDWSFHLRELLRYHLADGTLRSDALSELNMLANLADFNLTITSEDGLKVDDANVIFPDLSAYNGVLHGIDELLFPPSLTATVMDQLRANPQFTKFLGLLEAASENITSLVEGSGPMTLFIPTNSAFEQFDMAVNSSQFDIDTIEMILQYHLVESNVFLNEIPNGQAITTLNGQDVVASVVNATEDVRSINIAQVRSINTAQVLDGGLASNGVIYVLDEVLLPGELPTLNPTVAPAPTSPSAAPSNVIPTSASSATSTSTALRLCSRVFYGVAIVLSFLLVV